MTAYIPKAVELLFTLAEGELEVEKARKALCSHPSFAPRSVFRSLDALSMGSISHAEIRAFLITNHAHCSSH